MCRNENDGNTFVLSVEFQCVGKMMIIQTSSLLSITIDCGEHCPQSLNSRKTFRLHEMIRHGHSQSCFIKMQTIIMNDRYHRLAVDQIATIFKKLIEWLKILQDLPHVSEENCTNLHMPNDIHKCHLQILPTNAQTMKSGGF